MLVLPRPRILRGALIYLAPKARRHISLGHKLTRSLWLCWKAKHTTAARFSAFGALVFGASLELGCWILDVLLKAVVGAGVGDPGRSPQESWAQIKRKFVLTSAETYNAKRI